MAARELTRGPPGFPVDPEGVDPESRVCRSVRDVRYRRSGPAEARLGPDQRRTSRRREAQNSASTAPSPPTRACGPVL